MRQRLRRWHIEQFGGFLAKLQTLREGSGTVLDNSMIVLGSGISDGNRHAHDNLPVLLCGGGGKLKPGRHVQFGKEMPMTNLYLSMLDHMGVHTTKLGDSTGKLENI